MGAVGDRAIFAQGTPESTWQESGSLARVRQTTAAALCPEGSRAVIVAPHPDDEILAAAGLMMQLAELGRDLLIIAVTDGDASHPGSTRWSPEALAQRRSEERVAAMQVLGLGNVPIVRLGIGDGKIRAARRELEQQLAGMLLPSDTVFATWRLDGHPDHEEVGEVAAACCRRAGADLIELPVWMWHWASPQDARIPWAHAVGLALTDAQRQLKRVATGAHRSQLEVDPTSTGQPVLPPWALDRLLRKTEVFFR